MSTLDRPDPVNSIPGAIDDTHRVLLGTLRPFGRPGWTWVVFLALCSGAGMAAYVYQLFHGLAATAMTDYFSWGIYIVNFVFFIGVSMAGTLISAILRLTGAPWRRPITRLAEAITLFALMIAGPMIMIDMGRPDRVYFVLLHARLQSPILWDVMSLTTYMAGSLLYLYLPMIPDLAILRDSAQPFPAWQHRMYSVLALGWRGNAQQHRLLEKSIAIMAIIIIPVAISIHTVTAWLFGMTLRPGWHSTIIGPDFVVGAIYSGIAAVITAIAVFRHFLHLHQFISQDHFIKLGRLLLIFGLVYMYFVVNEHLGDIYTNERSQRHVSELLFVGKYALQFWFMVIVGLVIPVLFLALQRRPKIGGIVTVAVLVNLGMWVKRYIIVVPTLASPIMEASAPKSLGYVPTLVEWSITLGGFAFFCLLYTVFAKLFPIVSIWEMAEDAAIPNQARALVEGPHA